MLSNVEFEKSIFLPRAPANDTSNKLEVFNSTFSNTALVNLHCSISDQCKMIFLSLAHSKLQLVNYL